MGLNKVIVTGRVANVPHTYYPKRGLCILRVKLEGDDDLRECHSLVFFQDLAERAEKKLQKGVLIFVEGSLHYYKHEFPGDVIYGAEIHVKAFEVISGVEEDVKDEVIETTKQFIVDINELLKETEDEKETKQEPSVVDELPF